MWGVKSALGLSRQPLVGGQDVQGVHVLALVLVQALDLHVEDGVGVHHVALDLLQVGGQALFVAVLDLAHLLQHLGVVPVLHQVRELAGVVDIVGADQVGDQAGQLGVGLVEPPPVAMPLVTFVNFWGSST